MTPAAETPEQRASAHEQRVVAACAYLRTLHVRTRSGYDVVFRGRAMNPGTFILISAFLCESSLYETSEPPRSGPFEAFPIYACRTISLKDLEHRCLARAYSLAAHLLPQGIDGTLYEGEKAFGDVQGSRL